MQSKTPANYYLINVNLIRVSEISEQLEQKGSHCDNEQCSLNPKPAAD